jgi:4-amino-4-deoxy-L-arabinose transferase-like glycosyltransferase
LIVVVFALWLRISSLGALPVHNGDESYEGIELVHLLKGQHVNLFTANGNLLSPIFLMMQAPFQLFFKPSLWVLRAPAVIAGLLAVIATYGLGRSVFGKTQAMTSAMILLCLPAAILCSRMGHEYCLIPLVGVIVIVLAYRGQFARLIVFVALACVLVHPINLMVLAWTLPLAFLRVVGSRGSGARFRYDHAILLGVLLVLFGIVGYWLFQRPVVRELLMKRTDLDWGRFIQGLMKYLLYDYLAPHSVALMHAAVLMVVFVVLGAIGVHRQIFDRDRKALSFLAGLAAGLSALHVIAGPEVLVNETTSRYGVVFIAPIVIAISSALTATVIRGQDEIDEARASVKLSSPIMASCLGGLMLISMTTQWFARLTAEGYESVFTIQEDRPELFDEAFVTIIRDYRQGDMFKPCQIACEDYFVSKPLEYLASRRPRFVVENMNASVHAEWLLSPEVGVKAIYHRMAVDRLRRGDYLVFRLQNPFDLGSLLRSTFRQAELMEWKILNSQGVHILVIYQLKRQ